MAAAGCLGGWGVRLRCWRPGPGSGFSHTATLLEAADLRAADPQGRGNAVGVVVVEAPGRAVGGLLDLLDTDQVAWYQIIHEPDAQAFRFLISFIVFQ